MIAISLGAQHLLNWAIRILLKDNSQGTDGIILLCVVGLILSWVLLGYAILEAIKTF